VDDPLDRRACEVQADPAKAGRRKKYGWTPCFQNPASRLFRDAIAAAHRVGDVERLARQPQSRTEEIDPSGEPERSVDVRED